MVFLICTTYYRLTCAMQINATNLSVFQTDKKNATVNMNAILFPVPNAKSNTTSTIETTDAQSMDNSRRNVSLSNYKILLDSLMEGIIKPMARVPNVTMAPLTWLKNSAGNRNATDIRETVTDHRSTTNENEPLKNESRQEPPLEAKVYNPLMPYPDEYPDEYQTIQNGPALIITRTTYTRIPDVTYTMVTTTTLPTYRKVEKAEEAIHQALFGDVLDEENLRTEDVIDEDTVAEATTMTTAGQYFDINVTRIEEKETEKNESKAKRASDAENPNETGFERQNFGREDISTTTNQYFDISVTKIDENEFSD